MNTIKVTVIDTLPENVEIGSKLEVIEMGDKEIILSLVGFNKQDENSRVMKRRNAIMKLRKAVGAPLDFSGYKPLTKDEIHKG